MIQALIIFGFLSTSNARVFSPLNERLDIFVGSNGSDSFHGTRSHPFKTPQAAVHMLATKNCPGNIIISKDIFQFSPVNIAGLDLFIQAPFGNRIETNESETAPLFSVSNSSISIENSTIVTKGSDQLVLYSEHSTASIRNCTFSPLDEFEDIRRHPLFLQLGGTLSIFRCNVTRFHFFDDTISSTLRIGGHLPHATIEECIFDSLQKPSGGAIVSSSSPSSSPLESSFPNVVEPPQYHVQGGFSVHVRRSSFVGCFPPVMGGGLFQVGSIIGDGELVIEECNVMGHPWMTGTIRFQREENGEMGGRKLYKNDGDRIFADHFVPNVEMRHFFVSGLYSKNPNEEEKAIRSYSSLPFGVAIPHRLLFPGVIEIHVPLFLNHTETNDTLLRSPSQPMSNRSNGSHPLPPHPAYNRTWPHHHPPPSSKLASTHSSSFNEPEFVESRMIFGEFENHTLHLVIPHPPPKPPPVPNGPTKQPQSYQHLYVSFSEANEETEKEMSKEERYGEIKEPNEPKTGIFHGKMTRSFLQLPFRKLHPHQHQHHSRNQNQQSSLKRLSQSNQFIPPPAPLPDPLPIPYDLQIPVIVFLHREQIQMKQGE